MVNQPDDARPHHPDTGGSLTEPPAPDSPDTPSDVSDSDNAPGEPADDTHGSAEDGHDPYHSHDDSHGGGVTGHGYSEAAAPDEGGPVKTFLEHLEDLRWTIIKSLAAVLVGMVVCLVAANQLVSWLKWPLEQAGKRAQPRDQVTLTVQLGTNPLWKVHIPTNQLGALTPGTNRVLTYELVPVHFGTNQLLALQPVPTAAPAGDAVVALKNYSPVGAFVVAIQLAIYGGLGLASPFLFYFIGQFVVPALRRTEKRLLYQAVALATVLFIAGAAFCYFVLVQIALNAAVAFSQWMNFGADEWRAEEYISFVFKFMLGMGLSFELPVVILTLVKLDLLDHSRLSRFRPYWVVVNLVLSSVLTPPDPLSMILMALPLQVLYEVSVFMAWYWDRRSRRRA